MISIRMPQMGETVEDGSINEWYVEEGARVAEGDPLLSIATDKADVDISAPVTGTLMEISVEAGQTVPVGTVIAILEED